MLRAALFVILLFSDSSRASTGDENVGFTWSSGDRSTWDILRSCLVILLSCTWTVLHLNIPSPNQQSWVASRRKLKWMLITIVAPEVTCSIALRQWLESRAATVKMRELDKSWTIVHSFYAAMGGYVLEREDVRVPLLMPEIITLLEISRSSTKEDDGPSFKLPPLTRDEIEDRSKSNDFAKLFTGIQIGWLVIQCIARGVNRLPVSPLEITTVAYALCTILAYFFWWHKPFDINIPTVVTYHGVLPDSFKQASKGWVDRVNRQRVRMTTRIIVRGSQHSMFLNLVLPLFAFSAIFSVVHLIAWDFEFPTLQERNLWRSCGLMAVVAPMIIAISLQIASIWDPAASDNEHNNRKRSVAAAPEIAALVIICYFVSIITYAAARTALTFEVFYCLRSMPARTYQTVAWVNYLPHV